jgi:enoyl-CoA hydratase/carnithine racemase
MEMENVFPTPQQGEGGGATPESPIIVKLDRHEARKTDAATRWFIYFAGAYYDAETAEKIGLVRRVYSTHSANKTHWDEYLEVLNKDILLFRVRVSNRGNVSKQHFKPEALKAPEEEVESIRLAGRDC